MVSPLSFGVKEGLMALFPKLFDDRFEGRPIVRSKLPGIDKGDAAPVHPETDGYLAGGIRRGESHVAQMWHEGFTRFEHLLRLGVHVEGQAHIATQLVRQDIERRLKDAGNGRDRAALGPQTGYLR